VSNYIFDMPHGGELVADPPAHAFGQLWPTATPEAVAICRDLGLEELSEDQIDFERTSDRKLYLKDEAGYFRYHRASLESAVDAGLSAYFVQSPGYLVLVHRPGAEPVRGQSRSAHPTQRHAGAGTGAPTAMSRLRKKYRSFPPNRLRRHSRVGGRLRRLTVLIHPFDMRGSALTGPAPRPLHDFESSARRTGQDPSVVVRRERDRHVVLGRDPVAQLRHVHRVPRIHNVETSDGNGLGMRFFGADARRPPTLFRVSPR
jgi:hypothetical protein